MLFRSTNTTKEKNNNGHICYCFYGYVRINNDELTCDCCGNKMHVNQSNIIKLKHLPFGNIYTYICIDKKQLKCSKCGKTRMQVIPFQADEHCITNPLETYIKKLLATNNYTNKEVSYLTGVDRNAIKDIDKKVTLTNNDFKGLVEANAAVAGFHSGQEVTYRDLLYGLLYPSGADAAQAIANNVAGSNEKYVELMNKKKDELKLKSTHYELLGFTKCKPRFIGDNQGQKNCDGNTYYVQYRDLSVN